MPDSPHADFPTAAAGARQRTRAAALVDTVPLLPVGEPAGRVAGRGEAGVRVAFLPTGRRRAKPSNDSR